MLLAPLNYWRVRHPVKGMWDFLFPALGAVGLTAALMLWPAIPSPYGATGFLGGLQNLYAILGGFFVAALTLLSTADSRALRQPLAGSPPPKFGTETVPLDRRRFLCLLFGYLAFSAFGLYALGFIATLLAPGAREILAGPARTVASLAFLLFYTFWLSHVFVSTMVGLYYFTDRLQRPDPVLIRDTDDLQAAE
ncbi:hypothetical protein QP166_15120 [Sphingomonas sp. LR60]|uniref:hypothetical protein n=1 Tax=Sphingomonas sp. LR60 TaxID=3050233 RepID=UPI002FE2C6F4